MEQGVMGVIPETESWLSRWLRWVPTSISDLQCAEENIISYVGNKVKSWFINIGPVVGKSDNYIRTISLNENRSTGSHTVPLVLVHGFGSALGLWVLNLGSLSDRRTVYAFDLLGFGRSSRPKFSSSPEDAEDQYVTSFEKWRQNVGLDRFILLGHSFGAYLASAYALKHPERVDHLILADPWGFPEKNSENRPQLAMWLRAVVSVMQHFNPMSAMRAAGPYGPNLLSNFRGDLSMKFIPAVGEDSTVALDYIYHCNSQHPSGEIAFKTLSTGLGWAKSPMINRITNLREDIPLTIIYGSRSWIDRQPGVQIKCLRDKSYVKIHTIQGSGHHVYADDYEEFNSIVHKACELTDAACSVGNDTQEDEEYNK